MNLNISKCKVHGCKNPKSIIGVCGGDPTITNFFSFSSLAVAPLSCKASLIYDLFFRK